MKPERILSGWLTVFALVASALPAHAESSTAAVNVLSAPGSNSCSVNRDNPNCAYLCYAGGTVTVRVGATSGTVAISGSCGGAESACQTNSTCEDKSVSLLSGVGICRFEASASGDGSGFCCASAMKTSGDVKLEGL